MSKAKHARTVPHAPQTHPVVRPREPHSDTQELTYFAGISARTVVSQGLCMHLVHLPPGARAIPHMHERHETAVYVLRGEVQIWYGGQLEHHAVVRAGEFRHIPARLPYQPFNGGKSEALAVLACTDTNEQKSVVLLPQLDKLHP